MQRMAQAKDLDVSDAQLNEKYEAQYGPAVKCRLIVVGDRRAREVLLLNRPISAKQALEWGWVNRVVPRTKLDEAVAIRDYLKAGGPSDGSKMSWVIRRTP